MVKNRNLVFGITLAVIAGLFATYFFIYTKNKEEALIEEGFRTLETIIQKFAEKDENYKNGITSLSLNKLDSLLTSDVCKSRNSTHDPHLDSLYEALTEYFEDNNMEFECDALGDFPFSILSNPYFDFNPKLKAQYDFLKRNRRLFFFPQDGKSYLVYPDFNRKSPNAFLFLPFEDFMESYLKYRFFKDILVFDTAGLYYTTTPGLNHSDIKKVIKKHQETGQQILSISSNEKEYKLFITSVRLGQSFYFLGGLKPSDEYQSQVRTIRALPIIIALTVVILIILAMPILKIAIMSKAERLDIRDIFLSGASVLLGTSFIFLLLIAVFDYSFTNRQNIYRELDELSKEILNRFQDEVAKIFDQLSETIDDNAINQYVTYVNDSSDFTYPNFNEILLIDSATGNTWSVITHDESIPPKLIANLTKRNYFAKIHENQGFNMPEIDTTVFIESIYSWTYQRNEAAISFPVPDKPAKDTLSGGVMAITAPLASVMHTAIPHGMGYAIIQGDGKVLFHNDVGKNGEENFLDEIEPGRNVNAAIKGRLRRFLNFDYRQTPQRGLITPIQGTPFFLVVFASKEFAGMHFAVVLTNVFSQIIVLMLFILLLCFLLKRSQYRKMRLLGRESNFNWLSPKFPENDNYHKYGILTLLNLLIISLNLTVSYVSESLLFVLLAQMVLIGFSTLMNFSTLKSDKDSLLFRRRGNRFVWILGILTTILAFLSLRLDLQGGLFLVGGMFLLVVVLFTPVNSLVQSLSLYLSRISLIRKLNFYNLFLLTWLAAVSVVPVYLLYRINSNLEEVFEIKFQQKAMVQAIWERNRLLREDDRLQGNDTHAILTYRIPRGIYWNYSSDRFGPAMQQGMGSQNIEYDILKCDGLENYDSLEKALIYELRPAYNDYLANIKGLTPDSADGTKYCIRPGDTLLLGRFQSPLSGDSVLYLQSRIRGYQLPGFFQDYGSFFWVLAMLMAISLYLLIAFIIDKVYYFTFLKNWQQRSVHNLIPDNPDSRNILMIGMPFSGVHEFVEKKVLGGELDQTLMINLLQVKDHYEEIIDSIRKSSAKNILLDNIDYNITELEVNDKKLNILEELLHYQMDRKFRVVLISSLDLYQIIDIYHNQKKKVDKEKRAYLEKEINRWESLLRGYHKIFFYQEQKKAQNFLQTEIGNNRFLQSIEPYLKEYAQKDDLKNRENTIMKIQELAETYYYNLWNSFSMEEKYLLYDLAQDNFVNISNSITISNLIQKGIIRIDNSLRIMNESFRNFILTIVKPEEALQIEKQVKREGSWGNLKILLIIIVAALIIFIGLAGE